MGKLLWNWRASVVLLLQHGAAFTLICTPEMFLEAPTGQCSMCVQAERDGKNMMEHGLGDEANAEGGGAPSTVYGDDEEGETDISRAAYENGYVTVFAHYLGRIHEGRIGSGSRAARTTNHHKRRVRRLPTKC
jgi:hypothetical protein